MPTGIDQSWGDADPKQAKDAGVLVVSMYESWDQSKNIDAAKVKAYHHEDIASLVNWESQAGAPLRGTAQGIIDATEAVRQLRALIADVGYAPKNRLTIYFSCDAEVTASQIAGPVANYYRATQGVVHAAGFGNGAYGQATLVAYLAAKKITDSEWQTYAWSGDVLTPAADFYQFNNGQKLGGASVDFDKVIHIAELGAWFAPNNPHNASEDDMSAADVTAINRHTDQALAQLKAAMHADAVAALHGVYAKLGIAFRGDPQHPDNLKSIHEALDKLLAKTGGTP